MKRQAKSTNKKKEKDVKVEKNAVDDENQAQDTTSVKSVKSGRSGTPSKRGKTTKKSKKDSVAEENNETFEENFKNLELSKGPPKTDKLKLKRLIVENFKSFNGHHEIGIFQNFSVILGPNGSGKSNIIDAICFALGVRTINLRTKKLQELIFKYENENDNEITQKRSGYVEMYFQFGKEEIICKRTINHKGKLNLNFRKF